MFFAPVSAFAEEAAPAAETATLENLRTGRLVLSAEGRRIGRVESLVGDRAAPSAVRIILNNKFVVIPVNTISVTEKPNVFQTSLTYKEVR